ncbi:MAG: OsmC domain/YcaO domain-containing protein, partial [Alteromonadaceae bacterium]|nr:OsmC domain/YcaO domain-containing protein [Alteromonadaceae bacterium]
LQFNDNPVERTLFYRAMGAVLEITLDEEMELEDSRYNLGRMYGEETIEAVIGSVNGTSRFHGLTPTNMQLEGLDRHQRLIENHKKLRNARVTQ